MIPVIIDAKPSLSPAFKSPSRSAHESRCGVCRHPDRQAIELAFRDRTISVAEIGTRYGVGHDSLYRHAHATGLLLRGSRRPPAVVQREVEPQAQPTQVPQECKQPAPDLDAGQYYAGQIAQLLTIPTSDDALRIIVAAIQTRASRTGESIYEAANRTYASAAIKKIERKSDDWLGWFEQEG